MGEEEKRNISIELEENIEEEEQQKPKKSGNLWKIIVGILILVGILAFIVYRVLMMMSFQTSTSYEETLSEYYTAIAKNDTNQIAKIVSSNFFDNHPLQIRPGRYELISYSLNILNQTNKNPDKVLLYSISVVGAKNKENYLKEAFFTVENGDLKILKINKKYKGKDITH